MGDKQLPKADAKVELDLEDLEDLEGLDEVSSVSTDPFVDTLDLAGQAPTPKDLWGLRFYSSNESHYIPEEEFEDTENVKLYEKIYDLFLFVREVRKEVQELESEIEESEKLAPSISVTPHPHSSA